MLSLRLHEIGERTRLLLTAVRCYPDTKVAICGCLRTQSTLKKDMSNTVDFAFLWEGKLRTGRTAMKEGPRQCNAAFNPSTTNTVSFSRLVFKMAYDC